MITVRIPNQFVPERTYVVHTMLSHYLGVPLNIIPDDQVSDYELDWGTGSIIIKDYFFGKIESHQPYADVAHLPSAITETTSVGLENIVLLYGQEQLEITRQKVVCHVDIFASAFFMLTRWEESLGLHLDAHQRFPAEHAVIVKNGYILRPVVDEYVLLLRNWLTQLGFELPAQATRYQVIPTCDVDIPYYWTCKPLWKLLGGRLRRHWNPLKSLQDYSTYKKITSGTENDPYDQFDYLMDLAEKNDQRFYFNFIGGGETRYEGYYQIDDPKIKSLMERMIARGHHIGLHPSYKTYLDVAQIEKEKQAVEASAGKEVTTSRQHYLRFAIPQTWQALNEAGITEDSSLGYASEPGFRCGTCKPFPVFDIDQRETLPLTERPLLIMDFSLRGYKNLSVSQSIAMCEEIKTQVKKHQGELMILWHNSSLSVIDEWEDWKEVLEKLME